MLEKASEKIYGKQALENVTKIYKQLYIDPDSDDAENEYSRIVRMGEEPKEYSLSHFTGNELDCSEKLSTPAGEIPVLTLMERSDFETLITIMACRCVRKEIPQSTGAVILDGLINRRKIDAHRDEFFKRSKEQGILLPDWNAEFKAFTSDKKNYLDALIVLSYGPYSNISADRMGLSSDEWLTISHTIRLYHECTHFICRRLFPQKIDAIWDELVADAIGLFAAYGHYDKEKACIFLGVDEKGYTGGRLENYAKTEDELEPSLYKERLDALALKVYETLSDIEKLIQENTNKEPFELISIIEEKKPEGTMDF